MGADADVALDVGAVDGEGANGGEARGPSRVASGGASAMGGGEAGPE